MMAIVLALLALFAMSLQRTYSQIPAKELRRRARDGDEVSAALYKAVAYGHSLRAVLWLLTGLSAGGFFVYAARILPTWQALLASAMLIWVGFVWLSAGEATAAGRFAARHLAPMLGKILAYLHMPIDWLHRLFGRFRHQYSHTGLYEKADLLDLLDQQQQQTDNRIEQAELEIMRSTLVFGDKLIRDTMTPRRVVKMVSVDDDLGPVVMDELHKSGHSRFPVYEGNEDNIIGLLFLRDLIKRRAGGKVRGAMKKQALYLHEDQSLYDALQAVLKTHCHLFIVVNNFEEYVGIITIEDVLEQIVGQAIVDEFDEYENLRAVATRTARKEHERHITQQAAANEPNPVNNVGSEPESGPVSEPESDSESELDKDKEPSEAEEEHPVAKDQPSSEPRKKQIEPDETIEV